MIHSTILYYTILYYIIHRLHTRSHTGVCEQKHSSGPKYIHIGVLAFRAPTQGLDCSFCCWVAWPRRT